MSLSAIQATSPHPAARPRFIFSNPQLWGGGAPKVTPGTVWEQSTPSWGEAPLFPPSSTNPGSSRGESSHNKGPFLPPGPEQLGGGCSAVSARGASSERLLLLLSPPGTRNQGEKKITSVPYFWWEKRFFSTGLCREASSGARHGAGKLRHGAAAGMERGELGLSTSCSAPSPRGCGTVTAPGSPGSSGVRDQGHFILLDVPLF